MRETSNLKHQSSNLKHQVSSTKQQASDIESSFPCPSRGCRVTLCTGLGIASGERRRFFKFSATERRIVQWLKYLARVQKPKSPLGLRRALPSKRGRAPSLTKNVSKMHACCGEIRDPRPEWEDVAMEINCQTPTASRRYRDLISLPFETVPGEAGLPGSEPRVGEAGIF
jgi:hypothetical protein